MVNFFLLLLISLATTSSSTELVLFSDILLFLLFLLSILLFMLPKNCSEDLFLSIIYPYIDMKNKRNFVLKSESPKMPNINEVQSCLLLSVYSWILFFIETVLVVFSIESIRSSITNCVKSFLFLHTI